MCSFGSVDLARAPFRIENACQEYSICFRQRDGAGDWKRPKGHFCLPPGSAAQPFAWDELCTANRLAVVVLPRGASGSEPREAQRLSPQRSECPLLMQLPACVLCIHVSTAMLRLLVYVRNRAIA